ncbi:MAG: DEAD/SNF2-like helicase [Harvfovirus sp.]|uniref:DEAD/SNF2-like helicase n=1 Tax=Harvfovirus sp. TaxID=2487768 RepID=A0A3G5A3S4_9VIRU|nr:MAG: DEAD/SNF2-like helicase [Harvfovirus sp.]
MAKRKINDEDSLPLKRSCCPIGAADLLINHFLSNSRGIMAIPQIKELITYEVAKWYKTVIFISPLVVHSHTNATCFVEYHDNFKLLEINPTGPNFIEIFQHIQDHEDEPLVFSTSFGGVSWVNVILEFFPDAFVIVDQFHNLTKKNLFDEDDPLYSLLYSEAKILFLSATPRIYSLEDVPHENESFIQKVFGPIVYQISFPEAIARNLISDYQIFIPSLSCDTVPLAMAIDENVGFTLPPLIQAKCMFLFHCLIKHETKKCVVHCRNERELGLFEKIIGLMNRYYKMDLSVNKGGDFEESKGISLLLCVDVMVEQDCDSVYVTYCQNYKNDALQRIFCSKGKDRAKIFMWCSNYEKLRFFLASIKEFDPGLPGKIKMEEACTSTQVSLRRIGELQTEEKVVRRYIDHLYDYNQNVKWNKMLTWASTYIDKYQAKPEIKELVEWIDSNLAGNIRKWNVPMWKEFLMKYQKFIFCPKDDWDIMLDKVIIYMDKNKRRPPLSEKRLFVWLKNQINRMEIINDKPKTKRWRDFLNKYREYFKLMKAKMKTPIDKLIRL